MIDLQVNVSPEADGDQRGNDPEQHDRDGAETGTGNGRSAGTAAWPPAGWPPGLARGRVFRQMRATPPRQAAPAPPAPRALRSLAGSKREFARGRRSGCHCCCSRCCRHRLIARFIAVLGGLFQGLHEEAHRAGGRFRFIVWLSVRRRKCGGTWEDRAASRAAAGSAGRISARRSRAKGW